MFTPFSPDNRGTLAGNAPSASVYAVTGATQAAATAGPAAYAAAYKKLLPKGGKNILISSELPEQVKGLKDTLGAPVVDTAIVLKALVVYLTSLKPELSAISNKEVNALRDFVTKLRAWPALNEIFLLASNEMDPPDQLEKVKRLAAEAAELLSGTSAKTSASFLVGQYEAVKKAQIAYWKEQINSPVELSPYELRTFGTSTERARWYGPVPMRPEAAKFQESGGYKGNTPPCFWGYIKGDRNPDAYSRLPGLADYLVQKHVPNKHPYAIALIRDQYLRLGYAPTADTQAFYAKLGGAIVSVEAFDLAVKNADPEWKTVTDLTYHAISVTHKGYRDPANDKGVALRKAYTAYLSAISMLRATVVNVCGGIPPVDTVFAAKDGLLQPTANWSGWRNTVLQGPAAKDLAASGRRFFPSFGSTFPLYVVDCLQRFFGPLRPPSDVDALYNWTPAASMSPFPTTVLDKEKLLALVAKALPVVEVQRKAVFAKLAPAQTAWAEARGDVKGYLLLAEKLVELGLESTNTSDIVLGTLKEFAYQLYGVDVPDPPADLPTAELKDWYEKALVEAAKAADPASLAGQFKALQAEYDKNPSQDTLNKLRSLKIKMESLVARRARRRDLVVRNTVAGQGSTKQIAANAQAALQNSAAAAAKTVAVGKVQITAGASATEKQAAAAAIEQVKGIEKQTNQTLGYASGSGAALNALVSDAQLSVGDAVQTQIGQTKSVADGNLPKKEKGSPLLLILLAGAAVYAQTKE